MHLKRYRSATVREALALARRELGPSALVLSTQLVPVTGVRGWLGAREVEVAAAVEETPSENRHIAQPSNEPATADPDPKPLTAWQEGLSARLAATGLDRALASEVAGSFPSWRRRVVTPLAVRRALAERVQSLVAGEESYAPIEVFIGAPGVGKTTTIAKIAAQERARRGAKLTLVAADGFRVGAVEQLRLYADIIGSPFAVARTAADLDRVLASASGHVLVDTAGRSLSDSEFASLFEVIAGRPGVRTHVVLPAGSSPRESARTLDAFAPAMPARVVLTRVDDVESIAPMVAVLRDRGLRASYLGTGQRVPEDLERATPGAFAAHVLGETSERERRA
jgi:flagellar biosynthesis protein FlhF